jgi:hypothetical protein
MLNALTHADVKEKVIVCGGGEVQGSTALEQRNIQCCSANMRNVFVPRKSAHASCRASVHSLTADARHISTPPLMHTAIDALDACTMSYCPVRVDGPVVCLRPYY